MTDLVERVAKAIYDSHQFVKPWDHPDTVRIWHYHMKADAKAAIAIVRADTLKEAAKVAMVDERPAPKAATPEQAKWWQYGRDDTSQEIFDAIRALNNDGRDE